MTGRESFRKYYKFIRLLAVVFSIFGKKGNCFLLNFFRHTNGNLGLVLRYIFLRNSARKVGQNISVRPGVYLLNVENLTLGNNVSIHSMCYIDAMGGISIGNDVSIAHSTSILSTNHKWNDENVAIKYNDVENAAVHIHDDVWIGCGVRILAGAVIGMRSVIAAGAVVTLGFPANSLVAGVPAKIVRNI